jgi:hypothetical protein
MAARTASGQPKALEDDTVTILLSWISAAASSAETTSGNDIDRSPCEGVFGTFQLAEASPDFGEAQDHFGGLLRIRRDKAGRSLAAELLEIGARCAALPDLDAGSADEIIGYDEHGLPK